jgi:cell division protein YceG involved in septum cleavage
MGIEKLETSLEKAKIKQTRNKVELIRFRDNAINKVKKGNYNFGKKRFKYILFKVLKDTHQKSQFY